MKSVLRICSVDGCNGQRLVKGLCNKHYLRERRHGTLIPRYIPDNEVRFWLKVEKTDSCWLWRGTVGENGYGQFRAEGRNVSAHRYSHALANGPILRGLFVCHTCDKPICVNPSHLFLGTSADNTQDMVSKNRQAKGEMVGGSKLTEKQVREIRSLALTGVVQRDLGRQFGVSEGQISKIVLRRKWKSI